MSVNVANDACDRCGTCIGVCPANALMLLEGPVVVDKDRCIGCGRCVAICPFGALIPAGMQEDAQEKGEPNAGRSL